MDNFLNGSEIIKSYVADLPESPGVYRMIDKEGGVLYVGKAKSLKKRVMQYTRPEKLPIRLQRMIFLTGSMEFIRTETEIEALLLEANLIKKFKPFYNILLKDDKSFPYIHINAEHEFPLIRSYRGTKESGGRYFGPFAGVKDVNGTIKTIQKIFRIRNCSDNYFSARKRPCLQYHIKRCTAPCVGKVSKDTYNQQVKEAIMFLSGQSSALQKQLSEKMIEASDNTDFELAAKIRDKIKALSAIQGKQLINSPDLKDFDLFAICTYSGYSCVQVFFFRGGQNFGNKPYYLNHHEDAKSSEILSSFIPQFYENKAVPEKILLSVTIENQDLLKKALEAKTGRKVTIKTPNKGREKELLDFALNNAKDALDKYVKNKQGDLKSLEKIKEIFELETIPERIEVYDNTHMSGKNMTGAMIVAGRDGFLTKDYRTYKIKEATAGDDFAMMAEVLKRRFSVMEKERNEDKIPDMIILDGGKGQLNAVLKAVDVSKISSKISSKITGKKIKIIAMSKGKDRNAGREFFHCEGCEEFRLPEGDNALLYMQKLRDEAHRFAVKTLRNKTRKSASKSSLDNIDGIGKGRKQALLRHFGSSEAISNATIDDLMQVDGISKVTATEICEHFK